ncbi:phage tail terminator-like protein [Pragia fontium]|uniref:phage tail terminator-like protein n=1 Tax=Pragia fontium TaxID=82985 RepID=UPI000F6E8BF2|nr:phage tail terminator-like protein [Pragia fontium]VEJ54630.1 Uncharacterised protein [Pragia fontium]
MNTLTITELLESRLATVATGLGLKVSYENVQFEPFDDIYLESHVIPAKTNSIDLAGDSRVYVGVYQVNVVVKAGSGKSKAGKIANDIINAFPLNLELSRGDFTVYINSVPSAFPAVQGNATYSIPVSMNYRSDNS